MTIQACSITSKSTDSRQCGEEIARQILDDLPSPGIVTTYITVNHDPKRYLAGMRATLGPDIPVIGCSSQGIVGQGVVYEEGFGAGALGLGGSSLAIAEGGAEEIQNNTYEKGLSLGRTLCSKLDQSPHCIVVHYDPLCGADPEALVEGIFQEAQCPILGGAAGHSFSYQMVQDTYQFVGDRILQRGVVAYAFAGDCAIETEICHGCSPVGVELKVTKADNNVILEFDGRPARDVWAEICGIDANEAGQTAALAIGIHGNEPASSNDYFVRAAYTMNAETGGIVLGPAIATGTTVMLHHRTVEEVQSGAHRVGKTLKQRLANKKARAVLGFECGARTSPFLGYQDTLEENLQLQEDIAQDAAWLGMMPWGEIYPSGGKPRFHNYSYPLLVITDA